MNQPLFDKQHWALQKRIRQRRQKRVVLEVKMTANALDNVVLDEAVYRIIEDAYGDFAIFFARGDAWYAGYTQKPRRPVEHPLYGETSLLPSTSDGIPPLMVFVTYCPRCHHLEILVGMETRLAA